MMSPKKKIMIVTGEASGDMYGGNLAQALFILHPDLKIFGIGGKSMRSAGVDTLVDISELAVVGLWEVLSHFKVIKKAFLTMKEILLDDPPDVIVLIDYPDFNLRLAKVAKKSGVPVVYFISPQVWAWRRARIKTIARLVNKMLVVFPFEEELYKDAGVDCRFVGHPLLDINVEDFDRASLAEKFGLKPKSPVMGILPGSRKKELAYNLPVMLQAYKQLKEKLPDLQGIIPVADTLGMEDLEKHLGEHTDIKLVENQTSAVMDIVDSAAVASGTATLEMALRKKPMVIIYKLSPLTYFIGRRLIKLNNIGIVNIVAGNQVVPEFVQDSATPDAISDVLYKYFTDGKYYSRAVEALDDVKAKLGGPGATIRSAKEIVAMIS